MRLLWVTSSFPQGGRTAGLFIPELLDELNRLGISVHVLTQNVESACTETQIKSVSQTITRFGWHGGERPLVAVLERGVGGLFLTANYFLSGTREGLKICRAFKPDAIFAEWLVPGGLLAWLLSKRTGIPYAARALGSDVMVATKSALVRQAVQLVARNACALFADGLDLCDRTSALAGGRRCHFAATMRKLNASQAAVHANPDVLTCCTVGRLHLVKGQDVLIEAAAIARDRGVRLKVYLVGEGQERNRLAQRIDSLRLREQVELTGLLSDQDLAALLSRVDCVVIPSRSESIPLVLGETVAFGKPVIATEVGDMKTLVSQYEIGYHVPPENPAALADTLERMARDRDPARFQRRSKELLDFLSVERAARTVVNEIEAALSGIASQKD